jgi:hypothetical protein
MFELVEIGAARQWRFGSHRFTERRHLIAHGFGCEREVPERAGHAEATVGIILMMNQMPRAQVVFNPPTWTPEMDAVMECFVPGKTCHRTTEQNRKWCPMNDKREDSVDHSNRHPGAHGKDCVRIVVVNGMKTHRERMESMAKPSVDEVFYKRPDEHSQCEQRDILNHDSSLSHPGMKASLLEASQLGGC